MPAKKQSNTSRGKRYTEAEKAEILAFVDSKGRGGQSAAAKKYGISALTISKWRQAGGSKKATGGANLKEEVIRHLAQSGFKFVRMVNALTGDVVKEESDPKIEKLGLTFGAVPAKLGDGAYVSKNGKGQLLVTLTLDQFLKATNTKA